jgi:hypothetical protein
VSFSIRNFKRSTIKDFFLKEELKRKLNGTQANKTPLVIQLNNSKSSDPKGPSSPTHIFLNETSTSALTHAQVSV